MIGLRVKTKDHTAEVRKRAQKAQFTNLRHAGAAIRLTARRSIRRNWNAAVPGSPPHTRKGLLKRAILYAVEKQRHRVVIGPAYSLAGPSGGAHEHGGLFRGQRYPKRPFMGPALMKTRDRLPRMWARSVR